MGIILKDVVQEVLTDDGKVVRLIDNISLKIKEKKITFVVGPSGSGKSLLLSIMNGEEVNSYGMVINDEERTCFLRQNEEDYFFCNTIYEELLFVLKKNKVKDDNCLKKIINVLKMVGLDNDYLKYSPFKISKGEQKRLALAKVLITNPRILILDEPFNNLDCQGRKMMMKLFRMMKLRYGKTFIIVDNNPDTVLTQADEVICLKDGTVIFKGNKFDFFSNKELLKEVGMTKPKLIAFSDLVKKNKGIDLGYRDDIDDLIKDIYRFVK